MGNVPPLLKYGIFIVLILLFLGTVLFIFYQFSQPIQQPEDDDTQTRIVEPEYKENNFTLSHSRENQSDSVNLTIETPQEFTVTDSKNDLSTKVVVEGSTFSLTFEPNTLPDTKAEIPTFKVKEAIPIRNEQIENLFLVKTEDGRYFILTDQYLNENKYREKEYKENIDAVLNQGNYLPMIVQYLGDEDYISEAVNILSSLRLSGQNTQLFKEGQRVVPIEYWLGDGGVVYVQLDLDSGTTISLTEIEKSPVTKVIKDDLQLEISVPRENDVVHYTNIVEVGSVDGRILYRYEDGDFYVYTSDVSEKACSRENLEGTKAPPCGSDLVLIEDKGVMVKFSGMDILIDEADKIVESISLPD